MTRIPYRDTWTPVAGQSERTYRIVLMGDACDRCKGTGEIWIGYPPRLPCPVCHGTGRRGG